MGGVVGPHGILMLEGQYLIVTCAYFAPIGTEYDFVSL